MRISDWSSDVCSSDLAVFQEEGGEEFIELALARTDARVRAGKTVSPSFLFAALLWKLINKRWQALCAEGEHPAQALMQAADSVVAEQTRKLAIQRRFQADMREIWFMRSEEHTSELQSLMRSSYAVFCLKKKK